MRQHVCQVCYTRYQVSFYLWGIESALKYCKVPKYYDQDCGLFSRIYWVTVCSDSSCCKRTRISFLFLVKRHRFCNVSNAFPTSIEIGLATGSSNISIPSSSSIFSSSNWTDSRISLSVFGASVVIRLESMSTTSAVLNSSGTQSGLLCRSSVRFSCKSLKGPSLSSRASTWFSAEILAFRKQLTMVALPTLFH